MNLVLATCFVVSATASAAPLLGPVQAKNPAAEWKKQLLESPTYHGTFTRETTDLKTKGTISSDPAHRKLHVHTSSRMGTDSDHYDREVDLVIDGTQVILAGASSESKHTSKMKLSPVYSSEAPFGEVPNVDAAFTFAGDLRQTILDCLDAPLTPTKIAHEWHAAATVESARARMTARHDPALTMKHPPNVCADVVFEASADNTLRGMRISYPENASQSASVDILRFELQTGADR